MVVNSPGFSFMSHRSQTWSWRKRQPRNVNRHREQKPWQTLLSNQWTRKGAVQPDIKLFAKPYRKMYGPVPTRASKSQVGSLDLCPHEATLRHSQPLLWFREGKEESWEFHSHWPAMRLSLPPCSSAPPTTGDHMGNPDFHSHQAVTRHPFLSLLGWFWEGLVEGQYFHHRPVVMRPSPLWCQWKQLGAPKLLPLPSSNEGHLFSHVNGSQMGNWGFYCHHSHEVASHLPQLEQCQRKPAKTEDWHKIQSFII